jgi:Amidohydrolase ring-opening protein (Amido_AtzD_TrzD)
VPNATRAGPADRSAVISQLKSARVQIIRFPVGKDIGDTARDAAQLHAQGIAINLIVDPQYPPGASAGIELTNNIVMVLGNAREATGDTVIAHAVMQDAIDGSAVLARAGVAGTGGAIDGSRIVNVLAKADPSRDGMLRRWRHIMLDDTDISATRHARAAVGGLVAGLTGCPAVFVSGGAEHQGPPGCGPVAVIPKV